MKGIKAYFNKGIELISKILNVLQSYENKNERQSMTISR